MPDTTITFTIKRHPLWKRMLLFPMQWRRYYAVGRRQGCGVIVSLYGSWLITGFVLMPTRKT